MYKLISESDYYKEDLLEVVARNRNKDLNKIKNPSINDIIHYSKLNKIDKVVNAIITFGKRESSEVGIEVDSDAD